MRPDPRRADARRADPGPRGIDPGRRRTVLRLGGLAAASLAGLASPARSATAVATPEEPVVDRAKGYALMELGDGLHWLFDGAYSSMFLVSSDGVIACDAPPTTGARYLEAVAEVTDAPVTHLVYSHEHVDHIGGSHHFPDDVVVVAHERTAATLARRGDPNRRAPTLTFADDYRLEVGDQTLELAYQGINHSFDNVFIHAPRQRVLMFVDVIYPGWMPYKNLGVAVDVPGFVEAHRQTLAYDFDYLVAGHVSRPGTREDVLVQVELIKDLAAEAERAYELGFGEFLADNPPAPPGRPGKKVWDLHDDYEQQLVDGMVRRLMPKWAPRLPGTRTFLRDNCWAMLETYVVQGAPDLTGL